MKNEGNELTMSKREVKTLEARLSQKVAVANSQKESVKIEVLKKFRKKVETIYINKVENNIVYFTYLVSPYAKEFTMTTEQLAKVTVK